MTGKRSQYHSHRAPSTWIPELYALEVSNLAQKFLHMPCSTPGSFPCPPVVNASYNEGGEILSVGKARNLDRSDDHRGGLKICHQRVLSECCKVFKVPTGRSARVAFAIIALFAYREIDDADLCSGVEAVLTHALQGFGAWLLNSGSENNSALQWNWGGPQAQRRPGI